MARVIKLSPRRFLSFTANNRTGLGVISAHRSLLKLPAKPLNAASNFETRISIFADRYLLLRRLSAIIKGIYIYCDFPTVSKYSRKIPYPVVTRWRRSSTMACMRTRERERERARGVFSQIHVIPRCSPVTGGRTKMEGVEHSFA